MLQYLKIKINQAPELKKILVKLYQSSWWKPWVHFIARGHVVRNSKINRYLRSNSNRLLQVGGGKHVLKGWLNGDLIAGDIYLNATKHLPFPSNSFDYVFTEQFFEHISYSDGQRFLKEVYRILKPGGVLRQTTPSIAGLIEVFQGSNSVVPSAKVLERHQKYHNSNASNLCHFFNDFMRLWGHQFIYDKDTLEKSHKAAGFNEIDWSSFGKSSHSQLDNLERHAETEWMKTAFQLTIEAKK